MFLLLIRGCKILGYVWFMIRGLDLGVGLI